MLNKAKTLKGYQLHCLDEGIGRVEEFYFDDLHWTIRYLVADTGNWLRGRQILISPHALGGVNEDEQSITVNLTKAQIEKSPSLESDKPVSRQFEEAYHGYYGWPMYWNGPFMWGMYPHIERNPEKWGKSNHGQKASDHHLRSTRSVAGYHIHALDGELGHVADFIIDDANWAIRWLIIDTRNWWPGRKVLITPQWIERVSWDESKVFINLTCEAIKRSPVYTDEPVPSRAYETGLYLHYNRLGYWIDEPAAEGSPH